jgi:hypothetical protein
MRSNSQVEVDVDLAKALAYLRDALSEQLAAAVAYYAAKEHLHAASTRHTEANERVRLASEVVVHACKPDGFDSGIIDAMTRTTSR